MRQLTVNGTSWMTFREVLEALEPFRTYGNLHGQCGYHWETARLPREIAQEYFERRDYIDYVVISYSTPIAWHDTERGWVMPNVSYSVTTSKAQGRIAPAVASLNQERV